MATIVKSTIEDLQQEIHDLYKEFTELRRESAVVKQRTRATENALSLSLLDKYGIERGVPIDMEGIDVGDSDTCIVRSAHDIMFVDGVTQYFDAPFVILVSKVDGYTPFSDFNLSSSVLATGEVGHRIRIPLERIAGE